MVLILIFLLIRSLRKQLFMERLHKIREHNKQFEIGETKFEIGINEYADYVKRFKSQIIY